MSTPFSSVFSSVAGIIRERAAASPSAVAVTGDGRPVTFAELDERSSRLAAALAGLGARHGGRIAYLDQNATEFWETTFAAAKLGAAITPLNFRLAGAELRVILDDAAPRVLVASARLLESLPPGSVPPGLTVCAVGDGPAGDGDGVLRYEQLLASGAPDDPGRQATGDDLAVLMYSSGTTGAAKGVRITAANLLSVIAALTAEFGLTAGSRHLVPPPYYHIAASGWGLIVLACGGQIVQVREPRPDHLLDLIGRHAVTHAALVPAIIGLITELPQASPADFASLRAVVYGASPISPALLGRAVSLFGCEFTQIYGLTETTGVGTLLRPADHAAGDAARLSSAGRPPPGTEVAVVDPQTGAPRQPGETGEILIRGANVTPGYWRRPEATAELFLPGGWLRTGDAGYLDAAGYLTIADRLKDIIISGGENIIPGEVEKVLAAHPGVLEAAVIGVPSDRWGETPLAFVACREGSPPGAEELIGFCRDRLAHYKCPAAVEFVTALPRNPSGKVLRRQLREPYWSDREHRVG